MSKEKKSFSDKSTLYDVPTSEELRDIDNSKELYGSNLFHLKITELLEEIKIPNEENDFIKKNFLELKKVLSTQKEIEKKLSSHFQFPITFKKSSLRTKIVGSHSLKTNLRNNPFVDVSIEIPTELFIDSDFKNGKYYEKRTFFLKVISKLLQKSFKTVYFDYSFYNRKLPIVCVELKESNEKNQNKRVFRLIPSLNWNLFSSLLKNLTKEFNDQNNLFLRESIILWHQSLLKVLFSNEFFKHALILLKLWLQNRFGNETFESFGLTGFIVSMFVLHLNETNKLNNSMSSYQIFKRTLECFVQSDWMIDEDRMTFKELPIPSLTCLFSKDNSVVFLDNSNRINLCKNVSTAHYLEFKHEVQLSLEFLNNDKIDSFRCLFLEKINFYEKFDYFLSISWEDSNELLKKEKLKEVTETQTVISQVENVLRKGLSDRIKGLGMRKYKENQSEDYKKTYQSIKYSHVLVFGFQVNPDEVERRLEKGPSPEDKQKANEFRRFWGSKVELRRFSDSRIIETVSWELTKKETQRNPQTIIKSICFYLLKHHFCFTNKVRTSLVFFVSKISDLTKTIDGFNPFMSQPIHVQNSFQQNKVLQIYSSLESQIRSFNLPLTVSNISSSSSILRYTNPYLPPYSCCSLPTRLWSNVLPAHIPSIQVYLEMEQSNKWPDDFDAIQHIKLAFYLELMNLFQNVDSSKFKKEDKIENSTIHCSVCPSHLLVIKDGIAFKIQIFVEREVFFMRFVEKNIEEVERWKLKFEYKPKLSSLLKGLHFKFYGFSQSVQIFKRWIHSHLFFNYFDEEDLELLVANVFLNSYPRLPPNSAFQGFFRTIQFLSSYDFDSLPVIIDFDDSMTSQDQLEISQLLNVCHEKRLSYPPFFIVTSLDKQSTSELNSSKWRSVASNTKTPHLIFQKLRLLSKNCYNFISQNVFSFPFSSQPTNFFQNVFIPSTNNFDFIISLRKTIFRQRSSTKSLEIQNRQSKNIKVDFNPVEEYLQLIRFEFSEIALFFYDPYSGNVVFGLWNPQFFVPKQFTVETSNVQHFPLKTKKAKISNPLMLPNIVYLLSNMKELGKGIVKEIQLK